MKGIPESLERDPHRQESAKFSAKMQSRPMKREQSLLEMVLGQLKINRQQSDPPRVSATVTQTPPQQGVVDARVKHRTIQVPGENTGFCDLGLSREFLDRMPKAQSIKPTK